MLIDAALLHFCAARTREVIEHYKSACVIPGANQFPRSADDLGWIIAERLGHPISVKRLRIPPERTVVRGFYLRYAKRFLIFLGAGLPDDQLAYTKAKEFFQVYLDQEALRTTDILELIHNLVLRASGASTDLIPGHATNSETIAEVAAMEFLFPYYRRVLHAVSISNSDGFADLAKRYNVPQYLIERYLAPEMMSALVDVFPSDEWPA